MKISKLGENKVKVLLSEKDTQKLGISFDDIEEDEITAKIFIGSLLKLLRNVGMFDMQNGDVAVDIAQLPDNRLAVYITAEPDEQKKQCSAAVYFFDDSEKLCDFCRQNKKDLKEFISSSLLFEWGKSYVLLLNFNIDLQSSSANELIKKEACTNAITIGRIKERAKLISHAPLEKILALYDKTL